MPARYTPGWLFFSLSGRIRRVTYALSAGFIMCIWLTCLFQVAAADPQSTQQSLWVLVFFCVLLVTLWTMVALTVKRFHDVGLSGFFVFAGLLPGVSLLMFVALCLWPGQLGDNLYGRDPVVT